LQSPVNVGQEGVVDAGASARVQHGAPQRAMGAVEPDENCGISKEEFLKMVVKQKPCALMAWTDAALRSMWLDTLLFID